MILAPVRSVVARQRVLIGCSSSRNREAIDPGPSAFAFHRGPRKSLGYARLLPRALWAIGCADVRFGILPPQSGLRRNDDDVDRSVLNF